MNAMVAECMQMTQAYLFLYDSGKMTAENVARQIYVWVRACLEARSLVADGSEIDLALRAIQSADVAIGFDIQLLKYIGFSLSVNETNSQLLKIDCSGSATASVQYANGENDVFVSSVGLSIFAVLSRRVVTISHEYSGMFDDSKRIGDRIDFAIFVNSGVEKCVTRWVFGADSSPPPEEIRWMIAMMKSITADVMKQFGK